LLNFLVIKLSHSVQATCENILRIYCNLNDYIFIVFKVIYNIWRFGNKILNFHFTVQWCRYNISIARWDFYRRYRCIVFLWNIRLILNFFFHLVLMFELFHLSLNVIFYLSLFNFWVTDQDMSFKYVNLIVFSSCHDIFEVIRYCNWKDGILTPNKSLNRINKPFFDIVQVKEVIRLCNSSISTALTDCNCRGWFISVSLNSILILVNTLLRF